MDEIFEIWPSLADLARDLRLPYPTVASWKQRGVPANRDPDVIAAALDRGHELTYTQLHAARQEIRDRTNAA